MYLGILGLEGAINCILARTSHQGTTSEKRTNAQLPKCPLFRGSTVLGLIINKLETDIVLCIIHTAVMCSAMRVLLPAAIYIVVTGVVLCQKEWRRQSNNLTSSEYLYIYIYIYIYI